MRRWVFVILLASLLSPSPASAHPVVQHAVDLVISPTSVSVEAKISMEQVLLVENGGKPGATDAPPAPVERWPVLVEAHRAYLLKHLKIRADGTLLRGTIQSAAPPTDKGSAETALAVYRIEYPIEAGSPRGIELRQTLLLDYQWQVACVVRVRQVDDKEWQATVISGPQGVEFGCTWDGAAPATNPSSAAPAAPLPTRIALWPTITTYTWLGLEHIIGWDSEANLPVGLDHLLFIVALVLVVRSMWDLIKVVTAFTLAHTLTLTLSVLNWVSLPERIVEPMIAASIVFIAMQNLLWPSSARGKARLAIAFAFGLFHGLGFAGGLKEAMAEMPTGALASALVSFSAGVELGHQLVVIPLFGLLYAARHWQAPKGKPRAWVGRWVVPATSCVIALAGAYFLIGALRGHAG